MILVVESSSLKVFDLFLMFLIPKVWNSIETCKYNICIEFYRRYVFVLFG